MASKFLSFVRPLFSAGAILTMKTHHKCRNQPYLAAPMARTGVPTEKVDWKVAWEDYKPVMFTHDKVNAMPVWADCDLTCSDNKNVLYRWNEVEEKVDRRSHEGKYDVVERLPRNPVGRTGMEGRGLLGRWGPNHAADPVVTRWKRDGRGRQVVNQKTGKPILQFVAIQRRDNGEWAIPGGMVDPGETVSLTLKREFGEEALNSLNLNEEDREKMEAMVTEVFSHGVEVYRGYVDDPRNTDNAWMETICVNYHDETGRSVGSMELYAGSDAAKVRWADISSAISLYASHADFIKRVVDMHKAHW